MKVTIKVFNAGTASEFYRLFSVEGFVLSSAPEYRTERGARRYAEKHGFVVVD